ncbi:HAD family hydrolase, partial [Thermoplasmatales archaeon ex4484_30]
GIEYVATHPDKVCPTQEGYIPDTGSFIALIETATDVKPKKILGKPNPDLINFLLDKFNLSPSDAIIFGDRLYTDILMGKNSNITTALMLTGESKIKDIEKYGIIPDFVFINFEEVLQLLRS